MAAKDVNPELVPRLRDAVSSTLLSIAQSLAGVGYTPTEACDFIQAQLALLRKMAEKEEATPKLYIPGKGLKKAGENGEG